MNKVIFNLCFSLIFALTINGQQCPPNEIPAQCADRCNRCENDNQQMCTMACFPGCQCIPGYTRDNEMNCIPREFCQGGTSEMTPFGETDELQRLLYWEDNMKGCPDENQCRMTCRMENPSYSNGVCTGPNMRHCLCVSCGMDPNVMIPQIGGPNVKSELIPPVGGSKVPSRDTPQVGGCPNLLKCIRNCEKRGHKSGQCTGPSRNKCQCISSLEALDSSLLSPDTVRGGCPVALRCNVFCNSRGFQEGICLGPKNEYCNCFGRVANSAPKRKPGKQNPRPRPGNPRTPVSGGGSGSGCPDLASCVASCQKKGSTLGFCSGENRSICQCV